MARSKWPGEPPSHPPHPPTLFRPPAYMHATRFWFYGREWAEKRSSKNKKGEREKNKMKRAVTRWKKNCSHGQRAGRVAMRMATVTQLQLRHRRADESTPVLVFPGPLSRFSPMTFNHRRLHAKLNSVNSTRNITILINMIFNN